MGHADIEEHGHSHSDAHCGIPGSLKILVIPAEYAHVLRSFLWCARLSSARTQLTSRFSVECSAGVLFFLSPRWAFAVLYTCESR